MFSEPCRFIVIEDKKLIKYISEETKLIVPQMMPPLSKQFPAKEDIICYKSPVLILVCTEKDQQCNDLNLIDSVLASQNMFLKAYDLGLGTSHMEFISFLNSKPDTLKKMGVPEDQELKVALILDHPKIKQGIVKRKKPKILTRIK